MFSSGGFDRKKKVREKYFQKHWNFIKAANAQLLTASPYTHIYMIKDQGSQWSTFGLCIHKT